MWSVKGVSVVLVSCLLGLLAAGCGGDEGVTQDQLDAARQEGAKEARDQAKLDQLQNQVKQLQRQANNGSGRNEKQDNGGQGGGYYEGGSSYGGPVATCATGVQVGPNTSCDFAMNVAGEYGSNPGASTISAYSPVTGEYYTMSCGAWDGGTVCTGGNNAAVYLP